MKMIKHYTDRVPRNIKKEYYDLLGIKLRLFATYADLLDKLFDKGYWIELLPFYTFCFNDKLGVLIKVYKRNDENFYWHCIYNEEQDYDYYHNGFGSSFWFAINKTLIKIIKNNETA